MQEEAKLRDAELESERSRRVALEADVLALRPHLPPGTTLQSDMARSSQGAESPPALDTALSDLQEQLAREAQQNSQLMERAETLLLASSSDEADDDAEWDDGRLDAEMHAMAAEVAKRERENDLLLQRVHDLQSAIRCAGLPGCWDVHVRVCGSHANRPSQNAIQPP